MVSIPFRKKQDTGSLLERARAALADNSRKIAQLGAARERALLASDDDAEVLRLDQEIDDQQRLARTQADRVRLLEAQAAREAAVLQAKRRQDLIERIEAMLAQADEIAEKELQAAIVQADRAFRKILELRQQAAAAWPWDASSLSAAKLTGISIKAALQHQIYKIGARPFLGGRAGEVLEPSFPGGTTPSNELRLQPEKIEPLSAVLREATAYASKILRGHAATAPEPAPPAGSIALPEPSAPIHDELSQRTA